MKTIFKWTVILRGHVVRNLLFMLKKLYNIILMFVKVLWIVIDKFVMILLFLIGLDWLYIKRNIRTYFT